MRFRVATLLDLEDPCFRSLSCDRQTHFISDTKRSQEILSGLGCKVAKQYTTPNRWSQTRTLNIWKRAQHPGVSLKGIDLAFLFAPLCSR